MVRPCLWLIPPLQEEKQTVQSELQDAKDNAKITDEALLKANSEKVRALFNNTIAL